MTEIGGTPEPRPFFEDPESNITVQLGTQIYMHCRVQNLQNTLKVIYFNLYENTHIKVEVIWKLVDQFAGVVCEFYVDDKIVSI